MSKRSSKSAAMSARIIRVERKCNRILAEVISIRKSLTPQQSELDDVINHLHRTAKALRQQSERERQFYSRIAKGE